MNKTSNLSHVDGTKLRRGERQTERTKTALTSAFTELIREKNYSDVTVGEIVERAGTGRSTFYRHFPSKVDVLVELHCSTFQDIVAELGSRDAWLADAPSRRLVELLDRFRRSHNLQFSISYKLGNDIDYAVRKIGELLARTIQESLSQSFTEKASSLPLPVVATSIAGIYVSLLVPWIARGAPQSPQELASHIHRLARGVLREAFGS